MYLTFTSRHSAVSRISDYAVNWGAGHEGAATSAVQVNGAKTTLAGLPVLPANARYVLHANECFDWGTYAVCSTDLP